VAPFTRTGAERVYALIQAIKYIAQADVPGAIVECGVWRGGSMMPVAKTLLELQRVDRRSIEDSLRERYGRANNSWSCTGSHCTASARYCWYESTRHELTHLFPGLVPGGFLDDYGHWQGTLQAWDEYHAGQRVTMLLNRVDYSARIGVKP